MRFACRKKTSFFTQGKDYRVLDVRKIEGSNDYTVLVEGDKNPKGYRHRKIMMLSAFFDRFAVPEGVTAKVFVQRFEK